MYKKPFQVFLFLSAIYFLPAVPVKALEASGYAVDLLPTALSLIENKAGYSIQAWAGIERVKVRVIGAHLYLPDERIEGPFTENEMNVSAFLIDYFFQDDFEGLWIGTGIENWNCTVRHADTGEYLTWNDSIMTLGTGYVFKLANGFYIDPFAAMHYRMNDNEVTAQNGDAFKRKRLTYSASLKLGYQIDFKGGR